VNTVPLIDLKFAAGAFSDGQHFDPTNAELFELPEWIKPQAGLFVAQVVGESMNKRIPNGAWCLFKAFPAGSRVGKVIVAEHRSIHDSELGGTYTVKVYSSKKVTNPDGTWKHAEIQLNPDSTDEAFQPITILSANENELRVIAEFLTVLK
ncbi:MAG: S24 family peptidase, partial [Burkholderiales bacterium]